MKHGDFLKIDFVGRVEGTKQIFDFTPEEVAKKENLHNPKHVYAPALVVIGSNMVIPGVEKHLMGMKVGEEKEFTVQPEDAFGKRNPKLAKVFPISAFLKKNINPTPGSFVEIDRLQGKVQSAAAGRVRVDFNHPLAGKNLLYWVKVVKVITEPKEKVSELFSFYGVKFPYTIEESTITLESDKEFSHEDKEFIQETIGKWIKELKTVKFSVKK